MAAYSVGLLALLGGDDDGSRGGRTTAEPPSPLEKEIGDIVTGVEIKGDTGDVNRFRDPILKSVECKGDTCAVVYSIGLSGRGRVLQDQRDLLAPIFARTDVQRISMLVTRDAVRAGVPAKADEETPTGSPLLETTCDRTGRDDVDWESATGAQILSNVCDVGGFEQGKRRRQEPVAPDDPAAKDASELPEATP
ncbi:MAG TPA: hypothetical protein VGW10_15505 [Solirubrobacteraceae bacterium]|nr:hypothetical protein [Solirubrobacteraceae bacterium]